MNIYLWLNVNTTTTQGKPTMTNLISFIIWGATGAALYAMFGPEALSTYTLTLLLVFSYATLKDRNEIERVFNHIYDRIDETNKRIDQIPQEFKDSVAREDKFWNDLAKIVKEDK